MIRWTLTPNYAGTDAGELFGSLADTFAAQGDRVTRDKTSEVLRTEIGMRRFYIKRYQACGMNIRRIIGPNRVELEWKNLLRFARWGIPTATVVAYGQERRFGMFMRGALVTEEIDGAIDLAQLARQRAHLAQDRTWFRNLSRQVAGIVRILHRHRFTHNDLHWRNLLLQESTGRVFLIDCPYGMFWFGPLLRYRIIKDLASLDKSGRDYLTRTQRLRFYLDYAEKSRLGDDDKRMIRKVLEAYHRRRRRKGLEPFAPASTSDAPLATRDSLREAGYTPPLPFRIALGDGAVLQAVRLLRVLPGKRIVVEATLGGRHVLAKLYIGDGSARHWKREREGIDALLRGGIATPAIIHAGPLAGGGHALLTCFLDSAESLAEAWSPMSADAVGNAEAVALLRPAFAMIGRLHAAGCVHDDLHLGNFLLQESRAGGPLWEARPRADKGIGAGAPLPQKDTEARSSTLYLIDGDAVRCLTPGKPLPQGEAARNLALLFAQLPAAWDCRREDLLTAWREGGYPHPPEAAELEREIARARARRIRDLLAKIVRDCTLFSVTQITSRFTAALRTEADGLAPLLADPDAAIAAGGLLKDGRTCTVAYVEQAGRGLVVKRYNIKGPLHALSRLWRPSRAWHSWREAHRLGMLGIATPAPLALIEERLGPLRRRAWLVSEFCPGIALDRHLSAEREPPPAEAEALRLLFDVLHRERIGHGDLKAGNLLWHEGRIVVLDLDAMRQHGCPATFARAWRKDRERLLRNWPTDSALHRWLDANLPQ